MSLSEFAERIHLLIVNILELEEPVIPFLRRAL
jgi:hypothetical protein